MADGLVAGLAGRGGAAAGVEVVAQAAVRSGLAAAAQRPHLRSIYAAGESVALLRIFCSHCVQGGSADKLSRSPESLSALP
jgi:hypothetical protein